MRRRANLRETLASLIAAHFGLPREHVKSMTVDQIISLIEVDHDPVHFAIGRDLGWSPDQIHHPSNLTVRLIRDHREKTPEDVRIIKKVDRVSKAHEKFRSRMLATEPRLDGTQNVKKRWPKRPMGNRKTRHAER